MQLLSDADEMRNKEEEIPPVELNVFVVLSFNYLFSPLQDVRWMENTGININESTSPVLICHPLIFQPPYNQYFIVQLSNRSKKKKNYFSRSKK